MFNLNEFNIEGNKIRRNYSFNVCYSLLNRQLFNIYFHKFVTNIKQVDMNLIINNSNNYKINNSYKNNNNSKQKTQCHRSMVQNTIKLLNSIKFYSLIFLLFICLPRSIKALHFQPTLLNNTFAALEGDGVVINCIENLMTNATLVWLRSYDREINEPDVKTTFFVNNNQPQVSLIISSISPQHAGDYKCQLKDKNNKNIQSLILKLIVYKKIVFKSKTELNQIENTTAKIDCIFFKDPEIKSVTFTWRLNGNQIEAKDRYSVDSRDSFSQLTIKKVNRNDTGIYTCELILVYEMAFKIEKQTISMNVNYKPEFASNIPKNIWIPGKGKMANQTTVNITCIVDANPKATFEWRKGYQRITNTNEYVNQVDDVNLSTLIIKRPERRSNEEIDYTCIASNSAGTSRHEFIVKEGSQPEKPKLVNFSYSGDKLVLVIEESYSTPRLDKYRIDFGTIDVNFEAENKRSKDDLSSIRNETYSVALPNELRGQQSFKIFAHNPIGWSQPSQDNSYSVYISDAIKLVNNGLLLFLMIVLFNIIH